MQILDKSMIYFSVFTFRLTENSEQHQDLTVHNFHIWCFPCHIHPETGKYTTATTLHCLCVN